MSAPQHAKNGSTKPVKPVSVNNVGANEQKMGGGGGALDAVKRVVGRVQKGSNPGVQAVKKSGNANGSNGAMNGYPHMSVHGSRGRNITSKP